MRFPYHGAGIGLILDSSILVGKRSDHPFHGMWATPGGGREKSLDANSLATAIREFQEETGVNFTSLPTTYLGRWDLRLPFFSWTTYFYRIPAFDLPLTPHEFFELRWVNLQSILSHSDKSMHFRPFTISEIRHALSLL